MEELFEKLLPEIAKGIFVVVILAILGSVFIGDLYQGGVDNMVDGHNVTYNNGTHDLPGDDVIARNISANLNTVYFGTAEGLEGFVDYIPLFIIAAVIMVIMIAVGVGRM